MQSISHDYCGKDKDIFTTQWNVRTADAGTDRHLRLDAVARFLQDLAYDHSEGTLGYERNPYWIVLRTIIEIHEPILFPDKMNFIRWWSGVASRWTTVRVNIRGKKSGRIETEAFWMNINSQGLPARIHDESLAELKQSVHNTTLRWKPLLAKNDFHHASEYFNFPTRKTDFDYLQHMNNAVQWHIFHELLALYPQFATQPCRAIIEHNAPIPPHAQLKVRHILSDLHDQPSTPELSAWIMIIHNDGKETVGASLYIRLLNPTEIHDHQEPD